VKDLSRIEFTLEDRSHSKSALCNLSSFTPGKQKLEKDSDSVSRKSEVSAEDGDFFSISEKIRSGFDSLHIPVCLKQFVIVSFVTSSHDSEIMSTASLIAQ
jgi:hypothetical protein